MEYDMYFTEDEGLMVTLYQRPNGKKTEICMRNISQEDASYFREQSINVSMEELTDGIIVLYGLKEGTPEEEECIYIVPKRESCIEAMGKLRNMCDVAYSPDTTRKGLE